MNRLDRSMLLPKNFYFFNFAAWAAMLPFLPLFYKQIGLTGYQIGLLTGIPPLVTIFSAPVWGGLGDYTRQYKRLLVVSILGVLAAIYGLSAARSFAVLIPIVMAYAFFAAPVIPMVDNTVMQLLGERKSQYGKQRMWGALGWGVSAPLIGFAAERAGLQLVFYAFLALMSVTLMVILLLPIQAAAVSRPFWSGVRGLLSDRQLMVTMAIALVGGTGFALSSSFLFLHLESIGASRSLMGVSLTFATLSELPVLFFSGRLLQRFNARRLMVISLVMFVIRAAGFSLMGAPWLVLPIQLLHGPTFSLMWVAGVSYVTEIAPEGMGATSLSLFTSVMMGMGGMLGSLLGGWMLDATGTAGMFRWAGIGVLIFLVLLWFIIRRRQVGEAYADACES